MYKRITPFAIITIALFICIPSFAQHFLGAFAGSALHLDTQIESPAQNNNAKTLAEQQAGDTIQFQLFVPAGAGQTTNGYTVELDLPGKTFSSSIGTISGKDWTGAALISSGSTKLSALFVTGATLPSTGYLGQIDLQVTRPLEDGATLIVKSMSLTSGRDVDPLDVSNAVITLTATSACPGDFDGNGRVDIADFLSFENVYGSSSSDANYNAQMDLDSSGSVDIADFLAFVDVYGTTCGSQPPPNGSEKPNLVVKSIRRLTNTLTSVGATWSLDGRYIAVRYHHDTSTDIYVMNASNGAVIRRLTFHSAADHAPAWSPDGRHIAFSSERDGNLEIYVIESDGSNLRRLTNHSADDHSPSWSPDGRHIAFISKRDGNGNYEIYVMGSDGSNPQRLTNHSADDHGPKWSPDGRHIAFHSKRDGNNEIYVMGSDGSNPQRLTNHSADDFSPSWSPDGRCIAFSSERDGNNEIYVMGSDGSNPQRLTNRSARDVYPSWSPDGRHIAFHSNHHHSGYHDIYVIDLQVEGGASGSGNNGGGGNVDPGNADVLSSVIILPNGTETRQGNPPQPTNSSTAPTISDGIGRLTTSNGSTVLIPFSYNTSANISGCYLYINGAGSYFFLPYTAQSSTSGRLSIPVEIPTNVSAGQFCTIVCILDSRGEISNIIETCIDVLELGSGALQISLSWNNTADVDLWVTDPSGTRIYWDNTSSQTGGSLDRDDTDGYGPENIFWDNAPDGSYRVEVNHYDGVAPVRYIVTINGLGTSRQFTGTLSQSGQTDLITTIRKSGNSINF